MSTPKTPYDFTEHHKKLGGYAYQHRMGARNGWLRCHTERVVPLQDALRELVEAAARVQKGTTISGGFRYGKNIWLEDQKALGNAVDTARTLLETE